MEGAAGTLLVWPVWGDVLQGKQVLVGALLEDEAPLSILCPCDLLLICLLLLLLLLATADDDDVYIINYNYYLR